MLDIKKVFDIGFYRQQLNNKALKEILENISINPTLDVYIQHFNDYGKTYGLSFSQYFDSEYYALCNDMDPRLAADHFLLEGYKKNNPSPYFDIIFYQKNLKNNYRRNINISNAFEDFITRGEQEGVSPSPIFDTEFYADIAGVNPSNALRHFINVGIKEAKNPSAIFDVVYYSQLVNVPYEKSVKIFMLVKHVKEYASKYPQGRNPSLFFDVTYYKTLNNILDDKDPLHHFVLDNTENKSPSPYFDFDYYQAKRGFNGQIQSIKEALRDYMFEGEGAGISPSPFFDGHYYLRQLSNAEKDEIARSKISAFRHYLTMGMSAGFRPNILIDLHYYSVQKKITINEAFIDFCYNGINEGISPHPIFNQAFYNKSFTEIKNNPKAPLKTFRDFAISLEELDYNISDYAKNPSVFFDVEYYSASVGVAPKHAIKHFLLEGVYQGINPSIYFDIDYYAAVTSVSREETLRHFLLEGFKAGYNPAPFFDITSYIKQVKKIEPEKSLESADEVIEDLLERVQNLKPDTVFINPSPFFNVKYYIGQTEIKNVDNKEELDSRFPYKCYQHFIKFGLIAGINPFPILDVDYYSAKTGIAINNAIMDFILNGAKKGIDPSLFFNTEYYKKQLPVITLTAIEKGQITAIYHYLTEGPPSGNPSPIVDIRYLSDNSDKIFAIENKCDDVLGNYTLCNSDSKKPYSASLLFDENYYAEISGIQPKYAARHYLLEGRKLGLSPTPYFDIDYYVKTNNVSSQEAFVSFLLNEKNPSPFFDVEHYKFKYKLEENEFALRHYLINGQNNDPSFFFEKKYYEEQLIKAKIKKMPDESALHHFLREGEALGIIPTPYFDAEYYKSRLEKKYPKVLEAIDSGNISAIRHYLVFGMYKGINPTPYFDINYYSTTATDATKTTVVVGNALRHYFLNKEKLKLSPSPLFDITYYLEEIGQPLEDDEGPFHHYLTKGIQAGKNPSPYFDVKYYCATQNKKIRQELALRDFLIAGEEAGLNPSPLIDIKYYALSAKLKDTHGAFADFLSNGEKNNISPSPCFDVEFYRDFLVTSSIDEADREDFEKVKDKKISLLYFYLTKKSQKTISPSPFFTVDYYLNQVTRKKIAIDNDEYLMHHFLLVGARNGLNPSPFFETCFYAQKASVSNEEALRDYLMVGYAKDNRDPSPFFNAVYYKEKAADLLKERNKPEEPVLRHFLTIGEKRNISPIPTFDSDYYLQQIAIKKIEITVSPIRHMVTEDSNNPIQDQLKPVLFFDPNYYQKQLSADGLIELKKEKLALRHYLLHEPRNFANPSPYFDREFYLQDLRKANDKELTQSIESGEKTALTHFLWHGEKKLYNPFPFFDIDFFTKQLKKNSAIAVPKDKTLLRYYIEDQAKAQENICDPSPFFDTKYYRQRLIIKNRLPSIEDYASLMDYFLEIGENIGDILPTPYFESDFYFSNITKHNLKLGKISLLRHFLVYGEHLNISPIMFFDFQYFENQISRHKEFPLKQNISRIRFFLTQGDDFVFDNNFNISPSPFFDPQYYNAITKENNRSVLDAFYHFLTQGDAQNISPSPYFNEYFFGEKYHGKYTQLPSVSMIRTFINLQDLVCGPSEFFDADYYRKRAGLVGEEYQNFTALFCHFVIHGLDKGFLPTPLFDEKFYLEQLPEEIKAQIAASNEKAFRHFLITDQAAGISPTPIFDVDYYAEQLSAEVQQKINAGETSAFKYFLKNGKTELHRPSPFFDYKFYENEVRLDDVNYNVNDDMFGAIYHFLSTGLEKGYACAAFFDIKYYTDYLRLLPKKTLVEEISYASALRYFILFGEKHGDSPSPLFDTDFYILQLAEADITRIKNNQLSAIRHYLTEGEQEGLLPTMLFDADYYKEQLKANNMENQITDSSITLIQHYFLKGAAAGLSTSEYFDKDYYQAQLLTGEEKKYTTLFMHFIREGQKTGKNPSAYFDVRYYAIISGVAKESALQDFLFRGKDCNFAPSPFYLINNDGNRIISTFKPELVDNARVAYITKWQTNVRNTMPYMMDWVLVEDIKLSFDKSSIPFIKNIKLEFSTGEISQSYYRLYPEYVERYRAYNRLHAIQEAPIKSDIITLTKDDFVESAPLEEKITAFQRLNAMDKLINNGLDSAVSIASLTKKAFFIIMFGVNEELLEQIYNAAKNMTANLSLQYANLYQTSSPYVQGRIFTNSMVCLDYQTLFGSLDYYNTDSNASIHSPAAYFFDLMRIIQDNIDNPSDLRNRRPDLFEIPLDSAHTFDKVIYLQIVNYVLTRHYIKNSAQLSWQPGKILGENMISSEKLVFNDILASVYNFFIPPCMLPLESSRIYLRHLNTSLFDFYSIIDVNDTNNIILKLENYDSALEYLEIAAAEVSWLKVTLTAKAQDTKILEALGIRNKMLLQGIFDCGQKFSCQAKDFYSLIQANREQLKELLPYVDLFESKPEKKAFYKQLYINNNDLFDPISITVNYDSKVEIINNLTLDRLKRIAISLFFSKKLNYPILDVQTVIAFLRISEYKSIVGPADGATETDQAAAKEAEAYLLDAIQKDIKTLALFKWINNTSKQPLNTLVNVFYSLTEYAYNTLFKEIRTKREKFDANGYVAFDSKGIEVIEAFENLLQLSQTPDMQLSSKDITCLHDITLVLNIEYTDFWYLINGRLLKNFYTNQHVINWLYQTTALAQVCDINLSQLLKLYRLVVGNEASNYLTLPEGLYAYLVSNNHSLYPVIYKAAQLYVRSKWFKENKISIDEVYNIFYSEDADFNAAKFSDAIIELTQDIKLALTDWSAQPALPAVLDKTKIVPSTAATALKPSFTISEADSRVCQKLAAYFKVDQMVMVEVFHYMEHLSGEKNSIAGYIFNNTELTDLKNTAENDFKYDSNSKDPKIVSNKKDNKDLISNLKLDADRMLLLKSVVSLIELFQLSAANNKTIISDIKILIELLKNGKEFILTLDVIEVLSKLKKLQLTFKDINNNFLKIYKAKLGTNVVSINDLKLFFSYTRWSAEVYDQLFKALQFPGANDNDPNKSEFYTKINQIYWLNNLYTLTNKIKYSASIFSSITKSKNNEIFISSLKNYYENYYALSGLLEKLIQNKSANGKNDVYELSRKIEMRKRDILVVSLLNLLNGTYNNSLTSADVNLSDNGAQPAPATETSSEITMAINSSKAIEVTGEGVSDSYKTVKYLESSDISEYILLDVETDGVMDTSFVSQAIASLQLYLQRSRLGVEKIKITIPEKWWQWLESYRLWEANRKLLLYPENYIEPDLRTQQSKEFKTFTQTLAKSNLDREEINEAFKEYFHQAVKFSNMRYVDACQTQNNILGDNGKYTMHYTIYLFAKTNDAPLEYYYRSVDYTLNDNKNIDENSMEWGYWNKLNVSINAQLITPAYAYNKLFVFWVETKYKQYSSDKVDAKKSKTVSGGDPITELDYKILYTYQLTNGTWQIAQVLTEQNRIKISEFIKADKSNGLTVGYIDDSCAVLKKDSLRINLRLNKPIVQFQTSEEELKQVFLIANDDLDVCKQNINVIKNNNFHSFSYNEVIRHSQRVRSGWSIFSRPYVRYWEEIRVHNTEIWILNVDSLEISLRQMIDANRSYDIKKASSNIDSFLAFTVDLYNSTRQQLNIFSPNFQKILNFNKEFLPKFIAYVTLITNLLQTIKERAEAIKEKYRIYSNIEDAIEIQYPGLVDATALITHDYLTPKKYRLGRNLLNYSDHVNIVVNDYYNHLYLPQYKNTANNMSDEKNIDISLRPFYTISPEQIGIQAFPSTETGEQKYADLVKVKKADNLAILGLSAAAYLIENNTHYVSLSSQKAVGAFNDVILIGDYSNLYKIIDNDLDEDFREAYQPNSNTVYRPSKYNLTKTVDAPRKIDFNGNFGPYYWEVFFFAPFYIANQLSNNQRFLEAREWYHQIFYPYKSGENSTKPIFKFPPFQNLDPQFDLITYEKIIEASEYYAFDPHRIAKFRPLAYMKTVVMHYIKNLIDWGDNLFRQNTRETINQAINLYMMANDLLGPKPEGLGSMQKPLATITLGDYYAEDSNDQIEAAFNKNTLQIFKALENKAVQNNLDKQLQLKDANFNYLNPYFSIPENQEFTEYWVRTADRLFKIRCSLDIEGVKQELALFAPPIDIRQLVRAAASGGLNLNNLVGAPAIPAFRFSVQLEYAKSFIGQVVQLGNALMSILERSESERLSTIVNAHQEAVLDLTSNGKRVQIDAALQEIKQIEINIDGTEKRRKYYQDLIDKGLLDLEIAAKTLKITSQCLAIGSQVLIAASAISSMIPQVEGGFNVMGGKVTTEYGGVQMSASTAKFAAGMQIGSSLLASTAEDLSAEASDKRREQEWKRQRDQAEDDLKSLNQQLAIAKLRLEISQDDFEVHQLTINNQQKVIQFYQDKFTNSDLYQWMIAQLMLLHKNVYDLAFSVAQSTERAYKYELPFDDASYFSPQAYDSTRRGLLAGESLLMQLTRLEKSFLDKNTRLYEITKVISLKKLFEDHKKYSPQPEGAKSYIEQLKDGEVRFSFCPQDFDIDFNHHTNRRIKSVNVSVHALAGAYQSMNLILTQDLQERCMGIQREIIISTGTHDYGIFDTGGSGRYLPFEGTDLVGSSWTLKSGNNKDLSRLNSVSDVVMTIQYTATYTTEEANDSAIAMKIPDVNADVGTTIALPDSEETAFTSNYQKRNMLTQEVRKFQTTQLPSYLKGEHSSMFGASQKKVRAEANNIPINVNNSNSTKK